MSAVVAVILIIGVLVAGLVAGVALSVRNPALVRANRRLRAENAALASTVSAVYARARGSADADAEALVICDIIDRARTAAGAAAALEENGSGK